VLKVVSQHVVSFLLVYANNGAAGWEGMAQPFY